MVDRLNLSRIMLYVLRVGALFKSILLGRTYTNCKTS